MKELEISARLTQVDHLKFVDGGMFGELCMGPFNDGGTHAINLATRQVGQGVIGKLLQAVGDREGGYNNLMKKDARWISPKYNPNDCEK